MTNDECLRVLAALHIRGSVRGASMLLDVPRGTFQGRRKKVIEQFNTDPILRATWEAWLKDNHGKAPSECSLPGGGVSRAAAAPASTRPAMSPEEYEAEALLGEEMPQPEGGSSITREQELLTRNRVLERLVATYRNQAIDSKRVREEIFKLAESPLPEVEWLTEAPEGNREAFPGVPILFCSDWHWGEVVQPTEIGGVNSYNLDIARYRAHRLIETTITLLTKHMVNPEYPGIIFALGGDMVSGNIHDELAETNDMPIMPVLLDIAAHLEMAIRRLKSVFKRVFVPCTWGNHGRMHQKVRAKEHAYSSFDWLISMMVADKFKDDPDVVFHIPDGSDTLFSVYGHRYLLTHGNQFRGGDGMIGHLGPVIRGDHKKRSRNAQIEQEYDTLMIGHFHQLLQMRRVITNGSLIGYNEYAHANNFGFEPPQQALWLTHPDHGITISMPVLLDGRDYKSGRAKTGSWVAFEEVKPRFVPAPRAWDDLGAKAA